MPTFSASGADEYICQVCARIFASDTHPPVWMPIERRENKSCGNVCPDCVKRGQKKPEPGPISLYEHCRQESGLEGAELTAYINRYYGHG
jgi:hypothetical protein